MKLGTIFRLWKTKKRVVFNVFLYILWVHFLDCEPQEVVVRGGGGHSGELLKNLKLHLTLESGLG